MAQPALLVVLDGAHADVRCIKAIVYKYISELDHRLPILRVLEPAISQAPSATGEELVQQLKSDELLWRRIVTEAPQHFASLLGAHQMLTAVADVCMQAAGMLESCHACTHPLLLSTGNGVVCAFMDLFCDIARVALLLDDFPRHHVVTLLHVFNYATACGRVEGLGAESPGMWSPQAVPPTDLPIFQAPNMVAYLQQLLEALSPRVLQIMELSVAPALTALFPRPAVPGPAPNRPGSKRAAAAAPPGPVLAPGGLRVPPIFHLLPPDPTLDSRQPPPHLLGLCSGGPDVRPVLLGPGGLRLAATHALCQQQEQLRAWVLLGCLVCPAALGHAAGLPLLCQVLATEIRLPLHEERCTWIGLLYVRTFAAPVATVPTYSAGGRAAAGAGDVAGPAGRAARRLRTAMVAEARHAVHAAVATALREARRFHASFRFELVQCLQANIAACKLQPDLLAANLDMLLALLALARYCVCWHFRHADAWSQLPPALAQMCGGGDSAPGAEQSSARKEAGTDASARPAPTGLLGMLSILPKGKQGGGKAARGGGRPSGNGATLNRGVTTSGGGAAGDPAASGAPSTDALMVVLELMDAMQDLVDLMEAQRAVMRAAVTARVNQLLAQHVVPGHLRLASSRLGTAALATTLQDVQVVVALVQQLASAQHQPADEVLTAALGHAWRTLQLHTLLLPPRGAAGDDSARTTDCGLPEARPSAAQAYVTDFSGPGDAPGQALAAGPEPGSPGAGMGLVPHAETAPGVGGTSPELHGVEARPGHQVGLQAAQVAAITQDPLFLSKLQEVCGLLEWAAAPTVVVHRHAGLGELRHAPYHLAALVALALAQPSTAGQAISALRALHWLSEVATPGTTRLVVSEYAGLAMDLAMGITAQISGYLWACLAPMLSPPSIDPASPILSDAAWHASAAATALSGAQGGVLPALLPLAVAAAKAGAIAITPSTSIALVEYVRDAMANSLVALLRNLTMELATSPAAAGLLTPPHPPTSTPNMAATPAQVAMWAVRPAHALRRVEALLAVWAALQPVLGLETQGSLMQLLCPIRGGQPMANASEVRVHLPPGYPPAPQLQQSCAQVAVPMGLAQHDAAHAWGAYDTGVMGDWPAEAYVNALLQRVTAELVGDSAAVVYSPRLCAFLAPSPPPHSTPPTAAGGPAAPSAGMAREGDAADAKSTAAAKSASLKLKQWLPAGVEAPAATSAGPALLLDLAAAGVPGPEAPDSGWVVALGLDDVLCAVKLFGPHVGAALASAAGPALRRSLTDLDEHLTARQPALLELSRALGRDAARPHPSAVTSVASLAVAVRGAFSSYEMSKVQATISVIARCFGLRSMVGAAVQQGAVHHAPLAARVLPAVTLPLHVDDAEGGPQPADGVKPSVGVQWPHDPMCLAVDWEAVVTLEDAADVDAPAAQDQTPATTDTAPWQPKPCGREYVDVWQLPRPRQMAWWELENVDADGDPVHAAPGSAGRPAAGEAADPAVAQILAELMRDQAACERWALLPLLLGLCASPPPPPTPGQRRATGMQLATAAQDSHALVLEGLVPAWHAALAQVLQSPAPVAVVLPSGWYAREQFLVVAGWAAAARASQRNAKPKAAMLTPSQRPLQGSRQAAGAPYGKQGLAARPGIQMSMDAAAVRDAWPAAFSRAVRA